MPHLHTVPYWLIQKTDWWTLESDSTPIAAAWVDEHNPSTCLCIHGSDKHLFRHLYPQCPPDNLISVDKNRYALTTQPRGWITSLAWCHSLVLRELTAFCCHKMLLTHYIDEAMLAGPGEHKIASILGSLVKHLYVFLRPRYWTPYESMKPISNANYMRVFV